MKPWIGVTACPHRHLHMHGTRECSDCWNARFDRYWNARFPDDEYLPFAEPVDDPDYAPDAAYEEGAKRAKIAKAS